MWRSQCKTEFNSVKANAYDDTPRNGGSLWVKAWYSANSSTPISNIWSVIDTLSIKYIDRVQTRYPCLAPKYGSPRSADRFASHYASCSSTLAEALVPDNRPPDMDVLFRETELTSAPRQCRIGRSPDPDRVTIQILTNLPSARKVKFL